MVAKHDMVTTKVILLYLVGIYKYYGKKGKDCILLGFGDGSSGTGCGDGDGLGTRALKEPELHVGSPAKNLLVSYYLKLHCRPRTRPPCRPAKLAVARSLKFWMQL